MAAAPRIASMSFGQSATNGELLLTEYFDAASTPLYKAGERIPTHRETVWIWFEARFRNSPKSSVIHPSFQ